MLYMGGGTSKLWWCEHLDGVGGVAAMMKNDLSEKLTEKRMSDGVMADVLVLEDVLRLICGYDLQSEKKYVRKTICLHAKKQVGYA